jgi:TPR repeat protein
MEGKGVSVDLSKSAYYFKLAADQGDTEAQYKYGVCLRDGIGVSVDFVQSAYYFKLAADQGLEQAQYDYAVSLRYRGD